MKAMAKCANQMGPDTPPEIVTSVATNAFTVLLQGSETVRYTDRFLLFIFIIKLNVLE